MSAHVFAEMLFPFEHTQWLDVKYNYLVFQFKIMKILLLRQIRSKLAEGFQYFPFNLQLLSQ